MSSPFGPRNLGNLEYPNSKTIPKENYLYQNFPNPFNPTITIHYSLKQNTHVKLIIYNLLGEEIKTSVNDYETAGSKQIKWDATDNNENKVLSGVYIYKLTAGQFEQSRKMILIR